ncbi:transporter substrate-binding domain-containing protein [Vibrio genomosp. F10 str. 9ZC157]|uniref:Uncharacterized protein n=2 Tax=Vibrio genomosp. F10 TaxID=723171 RepID=A0A1E5BD06_9VIBR|nr:transporter substrate-binding domain-containing protein [Vibrio genomosp. F10]OEE32735.1 hypothetical protein A1QO_11310 [Vibrio genomosp. F10 str. ZF-129]OEE96331.1 hypothetical protein A1QM_03700 [Vibrio genomosp. F10 str. 9ZC157]
MKKWLMLGAALMFASPSHSTSSVEVLGIEFPPYTTEYKADGGLAVQKLRQHIAMSDMRLSAVILPPNRIGKRLLVGNWCLSFYPPQDPNSSNVRKWVLSDEEIPLGFYRLRQESEFTWEQLSDLEGVSVALLSSYSKQGLNALFRSNKIEVQEVNSLQQGFDQLIKNRVDYVFADKYSGEFIAEENNVDIQRLQFSTSSLSIEYFHVWVNLDCQALVDKISTHW